MSNVILLGKEKEARNEREGMDGCRLLERVPGGVLGRLGRREVGGTEASENAIKINGRLFFIICAISVSQGCYRNRPVTPPTPLPTTNRC